VIDGNMPNRGLIDNLSEGCSVEVACSLAATRIIPATLGGERKEHQRPAFGAVGLTFDQPSHASVSASFYVP